MMLAAASEVLAQLGLAESAGAPSTAAAALKSATVLVERQIRTPLEALNVTDIFGSDVHRTSGTPTSPEYMLNLSRGFINPEFPVRVYYSTTQQPIASVTDSHVARLPDDEYEIDFTYGRVRLYTTRVLWEGRRRRVAVRYSAGFECDENGLAQNVPADLAQGAILLAAITMRNSNSPRPKTDRTLEAQNAALRAQVDTMLSGYTRSLMVGAAPEFTDTIRVSSSR